MKTKTSVTSRHLPAHKTLATESAIFRQCYRQIVSICWALLYNAGVVTIIITYNFEVAQHNITAIIHRHRLLAIPTPPSRRISHISDLPVSTLASSSRAAIGQESACMVRGTPEASLQPVGVVNSYGTVLGRGGAPFDQRWWDGSTAVRPWTRPVPALWVQLRKPPSRC